MKLSSCRWGRVFAILLFPWPRGSPPSLSLASGHGWLFRGSSSRDRSSFLESSGGLGALLPSLGLSFTWVHCLVQYRRCFARGVVSSRPSSGCSFGRRRCARSEGVPNQELVAGSCSARVHPWCPIAEHGCSPSSGLDLDTDAGNQGKRCCGQHDNTCISPHPPPSSPAALTTFLSVGGIRTGGLGGRGRTGRGGRRGRRRQRRRAARGVRRGSGGEFDPHEVVSSCCCRSRLVAFVRCWCWCCFVLPVAEWRRTTRPACMCY